MNGRTSSVHSLVHAAVQAAGLTQRTDPELLAAFRNGDASAFEALVRRHGPMVLQTCRQVTRCEADAEDAFQLAFVALYQKGATIREPSVAGWLFRVARRAAGNARRAMERRDCREAAVVRPEVSETSDPSWRDACAVLHAELDRLPETYRLPLILCYLEGLSRDEAAQRLGWSVNTLRGRLERARTRLRDRVDRRGITLSAGLLAALGAGNANALPAKLVPATINATRHAIPARLSLPWKTVTMIAVAATVIIGITAQDGGLNAQPRAKPKPAAVQKEADAPKSTVSGRVLDPDGKPVAGAKLFVRQPAEKEASEAAGRTDSAGNFKVSLADMRPEERVTVAAVADGFAAGWQTWTGPPSGELTIALAKDDAPVRGRILDLEGKPVRGATVRLQSVQFFPKDGPDAYVQWLAGERTRPMQNTLFGVPPGTTSDAITDAEGKFQLSGIGRDRIAHLHIVGSGIAYESIYLVTVKTLAATPSAQRQVLRGQLRPHSASIAPIRGTVRDATTGKPLAGLKVNGYGGLSEAVTDKDGRYELPGYKKGPKYTVYTGPADGSKYFPAMAEATDTAGLDALEINLSVRPGVPIHGKVLDTISGKPVAGALTYYAVAGNPNVAGTPVGEFYTQAVKLRPDGTFTIAALPGPGFLGLTVREGSYPAARVDAAAFFPDAINPKPTHDRIWIAVGGQGLTSIDQELFHAIVLLNVDADKPPGEQRIDLSPAEPIRGRVVDQDGKPLTGVRIRGLRYIGDDWSQPLAGADFTAGPPHPDRPRRLTFRQDEKKLAGTSLATGGTPKAVDYKLEPWGTLLGRVVDEDGKPVAKAILNSLAMKGPDGKSMEGVRALTEITDQDGKFKIDGLIPGVEYELFIRESKPNGRSGVIAGALHVKPGQERDLGELKLAPKKP